MADNKKIPFSMMTSEIREPEKLNGNGTLRDTYYFDTAVDFTNWNNIYGIPVGSYVSIKSDPGSLFFVNPEGKLTTIGSEIGSVSGIVSTPEVWKDKEKVDNNALVAVTETLEDGSVFKSLKIGDGKNNINKIPYAANLKAGAGYASVEQIDGNTDGQYYFSKENSSTGENQWKIPDDKDPAEKGKRINPEASGSRATALGKYTVASGENAMAINYDTRASGKKSFSANSNTDAIGVASFSTGHLTEAQGDSSFTTGTHTRASGNSSFAGGFGVRADEEKGIEENYTEAIGESSFSFGKSTKAKGDYSLALGRESQAEGEGSFAGGKGSLALSDSAFAYGLRAKADGARSVSLGEDSWAQGGGTIAIGKSAHAGDAPNDKGKSPTGVVAIGEGTRAINNGTIALGRWNEVNSAAPLVVGYGSDDNTRLNVLEMKRNGVLQLKPWKDSKNPIQEAALTLVSRDDTKTNNEIYTQTTLTRTQLEALIKLLGTKEGSVSNQIQVAINNLINKAPGTLDTLGEIAQWINNNDDLILEITSKANTSWVEEQLEAFASKKSVEDIYNYDEINNIESGMLVEEMNSRLEAELAINEEISKLKTEIANLKQRIEALEKNN